MWQQQQQQMQTDLAAQQDKWHTATQQTHGDATGLGPLRSEAEGDGGLPLPNRLAAASLPIQAEAEPNSAGLAAQGQALGAPPADAAAMLQAQRRVLLHLRQKVAAAAAQQQLLQQQAQQQDGRGHPQLAAEAGSLQQQQHSLPLSQAAQPQADLQQQRQHSLTHSLGQQRQHSLTNSLGQQRQPSLGARQLSLGQLQRQPSAANVAMQAVAQAVANAHVAQEAAPLVDAPGPLLEVDSDFLEKEGDRVASALAGGRAERSWALNALCLLSCKQDLRLSATPGLLPALLPVLQEGLASAVGLGSNDPGVCGAAASLDEQRRQQGLPSLPGWQRRRAERACQGLFPDRLRLEQRLQEAAAAAVVLRNAAEVQQNSALLLDPPVMRCWTWALDAARELVQQQVCDRGGGGGGGEEGAAGDGSAQAGAASGEANGGAGAEEPTASKGSGDSGADTSTGNGGLVVGTGGIAADICTTLLQMVTVLSGRMLLPAFFECGMLLLRSLLILMRPSWQYAAAAAGGAALPPPIVSLATLAVTAVATAYQPNTDILLSMTGAPSGGRPGATLMQVVADLLICPHEVFRQHAQQQVDEESPGWRLLLPTDGELVAEARRSSRAGKLAGRTALLDSAAASGDRSAAELCTLDMLAVLAQLRYLSALLHLLWRLLTAAGRAGALARAAVAGCPRLLATLCEIAVHRWPQHPVRWHADGHALRHPDAYPAYLRFLSHDMMPAMRERQELLQPLRADAAALLALLAADPETRPHVAWCEGQLVTAVMLGVVPATEPGISALLARFAAQGAGRGSGAGPNAPDDVLGPGPMAGVQQQPQAPPQAPPQSVD